MNISVFVFQSNYPFSVFGLRTYNFQGNIWLDVLSLFDMIIHYSLQTGQR